LPANPTWLRRLPQIRATLEEVKEPFFDRSGIERLFGVRRRQAVVLIRKIGAFKLGHTYVVPRVRIRAFLTDPPLAKSARLERVRRSNLRYAIDEARRDVAARSVKISLSPVAKDATIAALPPTIRFAANELRVTFKDSADLLQQLFTLSQAIARDYAGFERILSGAPAYK
jgi:hypothetical protein